ncbi:hypothetical protein JCM10908_004645 [Rhodotorula pacifica]|uniref:GAF domain-containing protein n=1 Tax=Rhodotorula pacifica TaxID=1495444 RepID=UPI00317AEA8B
MAPSSSSSSHEYAFNLANGTPLYAAGGGAEDRASPRSVGHIKHESIASDAGSYGRPAFAHRPDSGASTIKSASAAGSAGGSGAGGGAGSGGGSVPRPYAVPPGLSDYTSQPTVHEIFPSRQALAGSAAGSTGRRTTASTSSSFSSLGAEPRSARISSEPPIPAEIHLMLMTTPPPPPPQQQQQQRKLTFSTVSRQSSGSSSRGATAAPGPKSIVAPSSTSRQPPPTPKSEESMTGLASRMKALRFLGGSGGSEKASTQTRSPQRPGTFADWTRKPEASGAIQSNAASRLASPGSPEREKRRRTTERRSGRMDSKTPADSVPKSWSDYALAYALGQMDINDPPFPPVEAQQIGPSPYDVAHFPAPIDLAPISGIRNRLIENLDLLNVKRRRLSDAHSSNASYSARADMRRGSHASIMLSSVYSATRPQTLLGDPALKNLLSRALYAPLGTPALFKPAPKAAMITLFPPSSEPSAPVTILASLNLPHNLAIPLSHALDAHVLLNGERGLVVPDTERDWRWRGNELVCSRSSAVPGGPYTPSSSGRGKGLGIRFYAAMPVFAPSLPELATFEEEAGGRIAIGTIAVMDDWPRLTKFGSTERAKLRSLASEVTQEIERFLLDKGSLAQLSADEISLPAHSASMNHSTPDIDESDEIDIASASVRDAGDDFVSGQFSTRSSPRTDTSGRLAQYCSDLANALNLSLVYVVKLDLSQCSPPPATTGTTELELVASHNLPIESHASFDPALHLRALRAPEGGLLFRSPADSGGKFASGVLLPIAETPSSAPSASGGLERQGAYGWVLAGYTVERERKWGSREMDEFEKVRAGLMPLLAHESRM